MTTIDLNSGAIAPVSNEVDLVDILNGQNIESDPIATGIPAGFHGAWIPN